MPLKWIGEDGMIEIIVDPNFEGDLSALAASRPIWIVDTKQNGPRIRASRIVGAGGEGYYISTFAAKDSREDNLLDVLGDLDDHYANHRGLVVHGLEPSAVLGQKLEEEGFRVTGRTTDGFVATKLPEVRDRLIGR